MLTTQDHSLDTCSSRYKCKLVNGFAHLTVDLLLVLSAHIAHKSLVYVIRLFHVLPNSENKGVHGGENILTLAQRWMLGNLLYVAHASLKESHKCIIDNN